MIKHNVNCAVVRCGDLRAWCDCDEGLISSLRAEKVSSFILQRAANRIEDLLRTVEQ